MYKFDWRNGFAVGLIAGAGLAILLLLFSEASVDPLTNPPAYCESASNNCPQYGDDVPQRWYWARRLFAFEDTIAQWIMTFFTVVAAGLLLATLRATQGMGRDARDIGKAQSRAYLCIEDVEIKEGWGSDGLFVSAQIRNTGNSPARQIRLSFEISAATEEDRVFFPGKTQTNIMAVQDISATLSIKTIPILVKWSGDLGELNGLVLKVSVNLQWSDVFFDKENTHRNYIVVCWIVDGVLVCRVEASAKMELSTDESGQK